jgi:hypothetical protein
VAMVPATIAATGKTTRRPNAPDCDGMAVLLSPGIQELARLCA